MSMKPGQSRQVVAVVVDRVAVEDLAGAVDVGAADLASGGNRAGSCAHLIE
jgi:hypothetical protein